MVSNKKRDRNDAIKYGFYSLSFFPCVYILYPFPYIVLKNGDTFMQYLFLFAI